MLQVEEGDRPLGSLTGATSVGGASSVLWKVIKAWLFNAASAAPSQTEALLHQFLGQESAPRGRRAAVLQRTRSLSQRTLAGTSSSMAAASAAALRRATDLLGVAVSARSEAQVLVGCSSSMDTTLSLCRKQFYSGLVRGLRDQRSELGGHPAHVLARDLTAALQNHLVMPVLQERYLSAAAVLAAAAQESDGYVGGFGRSFGDAASDADLGGASSEAGQELDKALDCLCDASNVELLHALCAAPLARFSSDMMSLAVFAWTWVCGSHPGWLLPLASRCTMAWSQSVDMHLGLFSGEWHQPGSSSHGDDLRAAGEQEGHSGEAQTGVPGLLDGLQCHQQWLGFLTELWECVVDRADLDTDSVALLLQRALHHALMNPWQLCSHPAAAAPRFRLLQLALRVAAQCSGAARAAGRGLSLGLALLRDRLVRAGLEWFARPAAYSAHLSQQQSEEQHVALRQFAHLLGQLVADSTAWGPALRLSVYSPSAIHGRSRFDGASSAGGPSPGHHHKRSGSRAHAAGEGASVGPHPVWGAAGAGIARRAAQLLMFLVQQELDRLQVWAKPVPGRFGAALAQPAMPALSSVAAREWDELVETAWQVSPRLAVSMAQRWPGLAPLQRQVTQRLVAGVWRADVQAIPQAAIMLATAEGLRRDAPELLALAAWSPGDAAQGLQLISSRAGSIPVVKAYAVRCLANTPLDKVTFFLPQLVQCLRHDADGAIADALVRMAQASHLFAHQLVWALQTEEQPPPEAMNPEVKRSGWQPPRDCGLWQPAGTLRERVLRSLSEDSLAYWEAENGYFDKVTSISGILKKVEKDERRGVIAAELSKFGPSRGDLYIPTNPNCRVVAHIPKSGTPMQSAAKVPILVAFKVEEHAFPVPDAHSQLQAEGAEAPSKGGASPAAGGLHHGVPGAMGLAAMQQQEQQRQQASVSATDIKVAAQQAGNGATNGTAAAAMAAAITGTAGPEDKEDGGAASARPPANSTAVEVVRAAGSVPRTLACLFKVGDDVRQDVLALQVIHLLRNAFSAAGLPAYLCPYGCLPTGYERGVIEIVPNTKSRAALGEMSDKGLYDIFQAQFGAPGSPAFEAARHNFVVSEAGYAIASFLLQAKDRHNGNLLVTNQGHLVHIDFGFILEISPGGNLGFESAAFKLSHEMTQLLDPGGNRTSSTWAQFEELCVRGYLVARTVAEPIIATVALMAESGLPCFGRGAPIANLRQRFRLDLSERQAAAFMRDLINDAYQKWTTGFYDFIQAWQQRIPY